MSNKRTVVITGASSGIGLGLARAYLARDFNVVGNARSEIHLAHASETLQGNGRFLDTPMHDPAASEFLNGLQPAGRVGRIDEIADAVLYLSDADFSTGVILPVDGGMSVGKW